MRRRFVTLDVFTVRPFTGNPLAVMLDGDALSSEAMQAIAREFNLSETVFVLPPSEPSHRARLRIFTPGRELPFAGHPTVGTAVLLRSIDGGNDERADRAGGGDRPRPLRSPAVAGGSGWARFDSPREPQHLKDIDDAADVAAALNLTLDDLGFDDFIPGNWSAGNALTFVPLRGLMRSRAAGLTPPHGTRLRSGRSGWCICVLFAKRRMDMISTRACSRRVSASRKDPANGSAAAAFAGLLAASSIRGTARTSSPSNKLRDGSAKPDPSEDNDAAREIGRRKHRRRCRPGHGRDDRGVTETARVSRSNGWSLPSERALGRSRPSAVPTSTAFCTRAAGQTSAVERTRAAAARVSWDDGILRGASWRPTLRVSWRGLNWGTPDRSVRNAFAAGAFAHP